MCHPKGWAAIHAAASVGDAGAVRELLRFRADGGLRDADGATPLHAAAVRGHSQVVQMLIEARASVADMDDIGRRPLELAAFYGHAKAGRMLLLHKPAPPRVDSPPSPGKGSPTTVKKRAQIAPESRPASREPRRSMTVVSP